MQRNGRIKDKLRSGNPGYRYVIDKTARGAGTFLTLSSVEVGAGEYRVEWFFSSEFDDLFGLIRGGPER